MERREDWSRVELSGGRNVECTGGRQGERRRVKRECMAESRQCTFTCNQ